MHHPAVYLISTLYLYSMQAILLSLFCLFAQTAFSQLPFTIYNSGNSPLPDDKVNCTYLDHNGNIWAGTDGGLVCISPDGVWITYTTADGLPDNSIRSVFVDQDNTVWAGTYLSGMAAWDGFSWTTFDPTNSGLPDYHIKAIAKDANDTMWIGTSWGLTKWDGNDYWHTYTELNSPILVPNINALYIDSANVLYAGTLNGGLAVYTNGVFDIFRTANSTIGDNTILSIDADAFNNKWLATSFGGLTVMTESGDFLRFTPLTSDITDWSLDAVRIDNANVGIIGMSSFGLEIFDNVHWTGYTAANSALPDDYINALAVDAMNRIWIGMETGGLCVFDRSLTGVEEISALRISAYPNPTANNVIISGVQVGASITLSDAYGNILQALVADAETVFMPLLDVPAGNYLIRATDERGSLVTVVQRIR